MSELEMALLRHEKRKTTISKEKPKINKVSKYFSKVLISIIFILSSVIYIKLSPENAVYFKKYFFEENLTFTKLNHWYEKYFGNILPAVSTPNEILASNEIDFSNGTFSEKGYSYEVMPNTPMKAIESGLLVFMGEKEGYGNTLIIQGVDGVDIWYGGLKDTDLKLYDYIDTGTILGSTASDTFLLNLMKDGKEITYEEYTQTIHT